MPTDHDERLEALLADALAAFDAGGEQGLEQFLAGHDGDRPALERGLARCRQMGLLGANDIARDFPDRLGEFQLLRRLGSGGMGVVYEAEQQSLGRRVALKVVRPELLFFEGARERFRREIEAVARLSHPAIVPVLASGEQHGLPWYAMELLPGCTVQQLCTAFAGRDPATLRGDDLRAAMSSATGTSTGTTTGTDALAGTWWQIATRIVHTVALGVRHAHLRGIVHRDIKPSNIMLTPDGRTVLLDFGIAMIGGGREFTRTGHTPGSPAFMSPEQLRGDAVDERTDIYSLAATLWQLLALAAPFPGADDLQRIRDGALPNVRTKNRDVPPELALVLETAMDRDRERRYPDIEAFANDLQAVLQRRSIRARRLGWPLRTWRWCQRHRVTATALGCALLLAFSLPLLFAWRERAVNRDLALAVNNSEQSLSTTLDAIYQLLVRVGEDRLRHVPEAGPLALDSLRDACVMYRRLLPGHPHHDRLRGNACTALTRYGELLFTNGHADEALATQREAVAVLAGDEAGLPSTLRLALAIARINLASTCIASGHRPEGERELLAAEADLAPLADVEAVRLDALRSQVVLHKQRASACDPQREAPAMEQECRRSLELARQVHTLRPDNAFDARMVVDCLDTLATMQIKNDRHAEAEPLLAEALTIARGIPADTAFWPPPPCLVAKVLETQGNLYVDQRDQRAVAALKECLALRETAATDFAHDVELRSNLGAALSNLARLNFYQAQDERALERLDRAIRLQRSVCEEMPGFRQAHDYLRNHLALRGSCLAKLGRTAELRSTADQLADLKDDPAAQRSAARLLLRLANLTAKDASQATTTAEHRRRALDLLLRAEQLGWGPGNRFGDDLYDALRQEPDFVQLQQRLAAQPDDGQPVESESTSSARREMPR